MISGIECCVFFSACCQVKAHYPEARLVLRFHADDPSALCQLGVKFGCTVEEGKKLLLRAREMELVVVGIR